MTDFQGLAHCRRGTNILHISVSSHNTTDFWDKTQSIVIAGSSTSPRWWAGLQSRDPNWRLVSRFRTLWGRSGLGFSLPCFLSSIRVDKTERYHICQSSFSFSLPLPPSLFPSFSLQPHQTIPLPVLELPSDHPYHVNTFRTGLKIKKKFFTID